LLLFALAGQFSREFISGRLGVMNLAVACLFTPLISGAASGFSAPFGWLLMQKPLRYMENQLRNLHSSCAGELVAWRV
jgi:hypothetical protein